MTTCTNWQVENGIKFTNVNITRAPYWHCRRAT